MIENVNGVQRIYPSGCFNRPSRGNLNNFDVEDKAIISSQAKMLNELEKYNAGESNEINLAITTVTGRTQIEAAVNVINAKKEMMDTVMKIVD